MQLNAMFFEPFNVCQIIRKIVEEKAIMPVFPFKSFNINNKLNLYYLEDLAKLNKEINFFKLFKITPEKNQLLIVDEKNNNINTIQILISNNNKKINQILPIYIIGKVPKNTSQGKIYVCSVSDKLLTLIPSQNILDNKIKFYDTISGLFQKKNPEINSMFIIKMNWINEIDRDLWIPSNNNININENEFLSTEKGKYKILSLNYMDGFILQFLSLNYVEKMKCIHFPFVSYTGFSKVQKLNKNKLSHNIFMEYLPDSLYNIIEKNCKNGNIFLALLAQVFITCYFLHNECRIVHNDLHADNIRIRMCPKNNFLYYYWSKEKIFLRIPTYGYIIVFIDFGRSLMFKKNLEPNSDQPSRFGYVSSEFSSLYDGKCPNLIPDNENFDIVRFIVTIEDFISKVEDSSLSQVLSKIIFDVGQLNDEFNLIKTIRLLDKNYKKFIRYYIEDIPRKHANKTDEYFLSTYFVPIFLLKDQNIINQLIKNPTSYFVI